MKKTLFSMVVLVAFAAGEAKAGAFDTVPLGSWPYSAVAQLVTQGKANPKNPPFVMHPMTRYELSVIIARWLDSNPDFLETSTQRDPRTEDIFMALRREFEDELARLYGRDPMPRRVGNQEIRIARPPRYKLTPAYFLHRKPQLEETGGNSPKDLDTLIQEAMGSKGVKK